MTIRCQTVLVANLARAHAVEQLRLALAAQGIEVLLLKGVAFLDTLYPNLGERSMSDADVLVRADQRPSAAAVLERAGYRRQRVPGRPLTEERHHEWVLVDPEQRRTAVELHVAFCQAERYDVDYDGIWQRRVVYRTQQRQVPTLSPEDSLLHVALHEGMHWFDLDLRSAEDIRRIVERWQPDWRVVVERARQWHLTANLFVSLLAARHHGARIPDWVIAALRPAPWRRVALDLLVDLDGDGRSRRRLPRRLDQLATLCLLVEHPPNLARFLGSYALLRWRDWRTARGST